MSKNGAAPCPKCGEPLIVKATTGYCKTHGGPMIHYHKPEGVLAMPAEKVKHTPLTVQKHEECECKHCRCEHAGGYAACLARCECGRYTWPGRGADMPANHFRATGEGA